MASMASWPVSEMEWPAGPRQCILDDLGAHGYVRDPCEQELLCQENVGVYARMSTCGVCMQGQN